MTFCFALFERAQHTAEYEALITGTKGSTGSKRLAADFITKFFAHFPDIADRAIEAQLDLCEDEDQQVNLICLHSWQ